MTYWLLSSCNSRERTVLCLLGLFRWVHQEYLLLSHLALAHQFLQLEMFSGISFVVTVREHLWLQCPLQFGRVALLSAPPVSCAVL